MDLSMFQKNGTQPEKSRHTRHSEVYTQASVTFSLSHSDRLRKGTAFDRNPLSPMADGRNCPQFGNLQTQLHFSNRLTNLLSGGQGMTHFHSL